MKNPTRYIWLFASLFLISSSSFAQNHTAPSLTAGIEGIVYGKGTLDAELIAEIIAKKQEEIKDQLVKNLILSQIEDGSLMFKDYAINSLNLLLNERNKKVMTRELLEYSVNLGMVYGFSEYYLRSAWHAKICDTDLLHVFETARPNVNLSPKTQALWLWRLKDKPLNRLEVTLGEIPENLPLTNELQQKINRLKSLVGSLRFSLKNRQQIEWYFRVYDPNDFAQFVQQISDLSLEVKTLIAATEAEAESDFEGKIDLILASIKKLNLSGRMDSEAKKVFAEISKNVVSERDLNHPVSLSQLKDWKQKEKEKKQYKYDLSSGYDRIGVQLQKETLTLNLFRQGDLVPDVVRVAGKKVDVIYVTGSPETFKINDGDEMKIFTLNNPNETVLITYTSETGSDVSAEKLFLNHIIVDMVFDICRTDSVIQARGFFQVPSSFDANYYQENNRFLALHTNTNSRNDQLYKALLKLIPPIKGRLDILFLHYELIRETNFFRENDIQTYVDYFTALSTGKHYGPELKQKVEELIKPVNDILDRHQNLFTLIRNLGELPKGEGEVKIAWKDVIEKYWVDAPAALKNLEGLSQSSRSCLQEMYADIANRKTAILAKVNNFSFTFDPSKISTDTLQAKSNRLLAEVRALKSEIQNQFTDTRISTLQFNLISLKDQIAKVEAAAKAFSMAFDDYTKSIKAALKKDYSAAKELSQQIFPHLSAGLTCSEGGDPDQQLWKIIVELNKAIKAFEGPAAEQAELEAFYEMLKQMWMAHKDNSSEIKGWIDHFTSLMDAFFSESGNPELTNLLEQIKATDKIFQGLDLLIDGFKSANFLLTKVNTAKSQLLEVRICYSDNQSNSILEEIYAHLLDMASIIDKTPNESDIAFFKETAIPKLATLKGECPALAGLIQELEEIVNFAKSEDFQEFRQDLQDMLGINLSIPENFEFVKDIFTFAESFVQLASRLNQLDKVETYEYVFRMLTDMGSMYGNPSSAFSFNNIVNNVRKYSEINPDKNTLKIDVESIILDIYNKYEGRQHINSVVDFRINLSVGTNYGIPLRQTGSVTNYFGSGDVNAINFVAEKVGVKFILRNFDARRRLPTGGSYFKPNGEQIKTSYGKYGSRPILSNIHLIAYGSGLLYQIDAITTADSLNHPILGYGIGATFFNGLDLNVTHSHIMQRGAPSMINVSFDIAFVEYLNALNEKRRKQKYESQRLDAAPQVIYAVPQTIETKD